MLQNRAILAARRLPSWWRVTSHGLEWQRTSANMYRAVMSVSERKLHAMPIMAPYNHCQFQRLHGSQSRATLLSNYPIQVVSTRYLWWLTALHRWPISSRQLRQSKRLVLPSSSYGISSSITDYPQR